MRRVAVLAALLGLVAAPAAAQAQRPVVYSSLPFQGEYGDVSRDVLRGMRLALERAGRPVRLVARDSSTAQTGYWTPEAVSLNARRASEDDATIAYIGEFNSGATAISTPILNEGGILQVSPSNTAVGLTVRGPGADRGEPDKFRPIGSPTFGRVIPHDGVQARAAAVAMREAGAERVLMLHDGEVYGKGLARAAAREARGLGLRVVGVRQVLKEGRNAGALAATARRGRADATFYGGVPFSRARPLWRALARVRGLQLFGGDALALPSFLRWIPAAAARRTHITLLPMAPEAYPEAGQEVLRALGPGTDVYALYGYEAMSVVLDAIARGRGGGRQGVVDAFFATRDRDSVLGRYSIDRSGDTSLTRYGLWGVRGGRLVWDRAVDAAAAP